MRYVIVLITIIAIFYSSSSQAQSLPSATTWRISNPLAATDDTNTSFDIETTAPSNKKSTKKAFVYSALVPGMGELYAGTKRGLLLTAAEVGLIAGYLSYTSKADDKKEEYEAYADVHWSFPRWENWYEGSYWQDIGSETFERHPDGSPVKDHHYYEKLGKYPWAQGGWDDFPQDDPNFVEGEDYSPHHLTYLGMRHDKNAFNSTAQLCASLVIANHVVSALHAAFTAHSHNKKRDTDQTSATHLNLTTSGAIDQPEVWVSLTRSF